MTLTQAGQISRAQRRRLLLVAVVRSLLLVSGLIAAYVLAPVVAMTDGWAMVIIGVSVVGIVALVIWQVRWIQGSEHPVLRGAGAFLLSVPLYLFVFSWVYTCMSDAAPAGFTQPIDKVDAFYFTVTVFATVGFGDITPVTHAARIVVTLQMLLNLIFLASVARVLVSATQHALHARIPGDMGGPATSGPTSPPAAADG